jgi:hypothetical protein
LRHEGQDEAPQLPPIHVEMPAVASSSQTAPPPPQSDAVLAQPLASQLAAAGGGIHSINLRVEQCQLDIQECLQHHHPTHDDKDHPDMNSTNNCDETR